MSMGAGGGPIGSGGGGNGKTNEQLMDETIENEEREEYDRDTNDYLQEELKYINERDVDATNTHLERLKQALEKDIDGSVELRFGGSIKKRTYVDGLSDVDVLVMVNKTELAESSPAEVKQYFADRLKESLPGTTITVGKLAVTAKFSDGTEIQLLPARKTATGTRIADENGSKWSNVTKPQVFAAKLSQVNQENGGKVVPVVKLFKAINATLPEEERLSSYHIEALATEAFSTYDGSYAHKEMLGHLVKHSSTAVMKPMQDETGQSRSVDDNLGAESSEKRQRVSAVLSRLSKRMETADSDASSEEWEDIISGD